MRKASETSNLTQKITHTLGQKIVTGVYSETNQLPVEAELCNQLGASRSILREAVKMLTAKGLIMARPRLGTLVRPEDQWNLLDPDVMSWMLDRQYSKELMLEFMELLTVFSPKAASLTAKHITSPQINMIKKAYSKLADKMESPEQVAQAHIEFHDIILDSTKNRFFKQLKSMSQTALSMNTANEDINHDLLDAYDNVVKAFDRNDSASASSYMSTAMDIIVNKVQSPSESDFQMNSYECA